MTIRVRFAPSPTGKLHVGNIRTALANALFAASHDGKFIVRMEDTDLEREVSKSEEKMLNDLLWLGITPDESPLTGGEYAPYRTRERANRGDYDKALQQLIDTGRAYECFVTQAELDLMRKVQRAQNQPPHYDNRHRGLSDIEKEKFRKEGRTSVIRFKLNDETVTFDDMVRGKVSFEAKNLGGDPVIIRSNGIPIFAFAGAVDDISQNITHVIRGEDHVTNTAIQVQIFEALGGKVPTFAHMPMLCDSDGGKLSKRIDSLSIDSLRSEGFHPIAIITYLASLGFSELSDPAPVSSLAKNFDLSKMGRSSVRFDIKQLKRVNAAVLRSLELSEISPYINGFLKLSKMPDTHQEIFWNAVRGNIETLTDLDEQYSICFGKVEKVELSKDDMDYITVAESSLPSEPYTRETWKEWVGTLKNETGRKGKALFMPLRKALTGKEHGAELADLLPVMGEKIARSRLKQTLDK